ncbi:putative ribonucleoside diphosphate reductase large subunit [Yalta virus]|nr:putative ribonucleoside diphosphate reductase large subunit [Yalta virus]
MESFSLYMSLLKSKTLYNYNNDLKNKLTQYLENFDDMGFICITKTNKSSFLQLVDQFLFEKNGNPLYSSLLYSDDITDIFLEGEKVFIKDFYEKFAFRASVLSMKNILFETISTALYHIYFFSISLLSFEDYFYFNNRLECKDIDKIKKISNYILYEVDPFEDNNQTPTTFKLLSLGHLLKIDFDVAEDVVIECPNYAYARICLELHRNLDDSTLLSTFNDIKETYYAPSTPMFFHSLTKYNLLSSCFLLDVEDSTSSIANLLGKVTHIQKFNSGIGINFNKIRGKGRYVLNGASVSNGVDPFVTILGTLSEHFRNNKRQRSANINISLSIDHPDIIQFMTLKMANVRKEDKNLNNLFLTVSIPDEFMYRLLQNKDWYLISPEQSINGVHLHDVYGEEYSKLYQKMIESPNIDKTKIDISTLFSTIANAMVQTGSPFLFFKDVVNYSSNHKHYGVLQGTNLCTEILEYFNDEETACCNLTSLNLKMFVTKEKKFDYELFEKKIYNIVYLLNNTIDQGMYSHPSCKKSNLDKRPLGIGIQGLFDMLSKMDIPYIEGEEIYKSITESLYYYALKASNDLAKKNIFDKYDKEKESPLNNGLFCFDMFKEYQMKKKEKLSQIPKIKIIANRINIKDYETTLDWKTLKENILKHGVVNSLVVAFMPTSLSSGIYNNVESFEPATYNILKRDFSIFSIINYNQKLVNYLLDKKYYNEENVLVSLMNVEGDFMKLSNVPENEKNKMYKLFQTMYDFKSKDYVKFISCNNHLTDQGKSTNIYIPNNENGNILKTIVDHWVRGTKTTYYYRSEIKINPKTLHDFKDQTCYACV